MGGIKEIRTPKRSLPVFTPSQKSGGRLSRAG